jgi:hypothetical protein
MKDRWISFGLFLILVALCTWCAFHDAKSKVGFATLVAHNQALEAILVETPHADIEVDGTRHIVVRREGETAEEFSFRVQAALYGGDGARPFGPCWESDCVRNLPPYGPFHIKICAPTQAELDKLVAAWCASTDHTCTECP